jgi:hypothetical protein
MPSLPISSNDGSWFDSGNWHSCGRARVIGLERAVPNRSITARRKPGWCRDPVAGLISCHIWNDGAAASICGDIGLHGLIWKAMYQGHEIK